MIDGYGQFYLLAVLANHIQFKWLFFLRIICFA